MRRRILRPTKIVKSKRPIAALIFDLRGQKVILDTDLAELYGVPTKAFNQAVKRNADRFPEDFMFQLTVKEWRKLRLLISVDVPPKEGVAPSWSQIVTTSARYRGSAYRPTAFSEHGAIMAATILKSPAAVAMSVFVVRAFMQMREQLLTNTAILKRLAEIDKTLLHHDSALRSVWAKLQPLLAPPPAPPPRRIKGFQPGND